MRLKSSQLLAGTLIAATFAAAGAGGMYFALRRSDPAQEPLSLAAVGTLSPTEAARRVLPTLAEPLADRVVEVNYVAAGPHEGPPDTLETISMRLRATGAGWSGVCVADYLSVDLEPVTKRSSSSRAVRATGELRLRQGYRIVGEPSPAVSWTDAREAELERTCQALGVGLEFFQLDPEVDMRTVTDMLTAIRSASGPARDSAINIRCTGQHAACGDPLGFLATLDLGRIFAADPAIDCNPRESCLKLTFATDEARPRLWTLETKGRYRGAFPNGWGKIAISELHLDLSSLEHSLE